MITEISFDLLMEEDMDFAEGSLRVQSSEWKVFVFSKRDVSTPMIKDTRWPSGVTGVCVDFPRTHVLNQLTTEHILTDHYGITRFDVVRGPDSMGLR